MPRIRWLGLALTISAFERELERSAAGKRFVCAHRKVRWFFETVSRLDAIRAFDHAELVETGAKAADDVPCSQIRISRSPMATGSIVVIYFCRRERKIVGISSLRWRVLLEIATDGFSNDFYIFPLNHKLKQFFSVPSPVSVTSFLWILNTLWLHLQHFFHILPETYDQ